MTYDDRALSEVNQDLEYLTCVALDRAIELGLERQWVDLLAYTSGVARTYIQQESAWPKNKAA